jgi:Fur family ferric uptake transcriptional regulator
MTDSPDVPALAVADPAEAVAALRASGLRLSTARRLVIDALFAASEPVSASRLSSELAIDESSVYRNLEVLERHGLVRHLHLGHGPGLYVLTSREEAEYLYCEQCTKVMVAAPEQIGVVREEIRRRFGYTARFTHFAIVGVCQDCAARSPGEPVHAH